MAKFPQFGYLKCKVLPGMFDGEFTVVFQVDRKEITSTVNRENVTIEREGEGWLRVRLLDLDPKTEVVLIELPPPAFTSSPRLMIPRKNLADKIPA